MWWLATIFINECHLFCIIPYKYTTGVWDPVQHQWPDGSVMRLGARVAFASPCSSHTASDCTRHSHQSLRLRIDYDRLYRKHPVTVLTECFCSGSGERAIRLFMDPPWCLSVTHRLWHRHHHLAPRVAFNDFSVKDVSVMLLLLFPQSSWQPQMKIARLRSTLFR